VRPYEFAAKHYLAAGWSPLPLPPGEKSWPPVGYTGGKGRDAEPSMVVYWIKKKPNGNVALRMPPNLIGIDVDNYEGKDGAATLAACEAEWGPLPDTWRTTSRTDRISGIRLFRIPTGLAWPGKLPGGGGVELCRWDHRYVIVAPSIHDKTGDQYHWFAPDGTQTTSAAAEDGDWEFPALDELAELPAAWVKGLTEGKKWEERPEEDLDPAEVNAWILDRPDGPLCDKMQSTLDSWMNKIRAAGDGKEMAAHDAALYACWAVLGDSAGGHVGVQGALRKIMLAHKEAIRNRRPEKAASEWQSMKSRGVRKVAAEGPTDDDDPCAVSAVSRAPRVRNRGSEGMDFERDDIGNGQRFTLQWRDEVRWVPAYDSWFIWNGKRWAEDVDGEVNRMAAKTARGMKAEAAYIEDPKEKGAFLKFVRASSNDGKLFAMLKQAKSNKGMTVAAETFNSNERLLVCPNGTIELTPTGSKFRRSLQGDYNTLTTGVEYRRGAEESSPEWRKFLEKFQPDLEIRDWLQKLAGYSLLGANPSRLMVFAFGETSTGKTTFSLAMASAMGEYSAATSMSVFRDNQDERPRADLVRVLDRRWVYSEEASVNWHLHPDQVKRLTGGAPIPARLPHAQKYMEKVPAFTPWVFTNNAPTIEQADAALWRRILVVPFDIQIAQAEEDPQFEERLLSPVGLQAILAWAVEGWNKYVADPDSISYVPVGATDALARFRAEVNDTSRFLEDCCEWGEPSEYFLKPSHLYEVYKVWAEEVGIKERERMNLISLGRSLSGMGLKRTSTRRFPGKEGKPIPVIGGIRIGSKWVKSVPYT
jgi:putative DNA primase/helicase